MSDRRDLLEANLASGLIPTTTCVHQGDPVVVVVCVHTSKTGFALTCSVCATAHPYGDVVWHSKDFLNQRFGWTFETDSA